MEKSFLSLIMKLNSYLLLIIFISLFTVSKAQLKISLTIKGKDLKNVINDFYYLLPSKIIVNDISNDTCGKKCFLDKEEMNNVTIIFNRQIESCENMFNNLSDVLEIDLSYLDFSKVTNMDSMFNECSNLKKINFGRINTSLVSNMRQLFHKCVQLTSIDLSYFDTSSVTNMDSIFRCCQSLSKIDVSNFNTKKVKDMTDFFAKCNNLESIDVSNFDTSLVTKMQGMFFYCKKLKYLDLSNFNTSSALNVVGMFQGCESLIYVNLQSFIINNDTNTERIFEATFSKLKICINELSKNKLYSLYEKEYNCNDICFNKNIKIDLNQNRCIKYCNESEYKYEYNNFCYEKCPYNTYTIIDKYLCLDNKPEGYYLDNKDLNYKKCFDKCKNCYGYGNEENNNCNECFINNILIEEKNKCVKKCDEDDIYIYEYKKKCYKECPSETIKFNNNSIINKSYCKPICTEEKSYEIISIQECVKNCPFEYLKKE